MGLLEELEKGRGTEDSMVQLAREHGIVVLLEEWENGPGIVGLLEVSVKEPTLTTIILKKTSTVPQSMKSKVLYLKQDFYLSSITF